MTRINVAFRAKELVREHLIAEHREIVRIPNCVAKGRYSLLNAPKDFKLGTGHVKFFYDKMTYLKKRYHEIYNECVERGYNVTYMGQCFDNVPLHLFNDYTETNTDRELLRVRLNERLLGMGYQENYYKL